MKNVEISYYRLYAIFGACCTVGLANYMVNPCTKQKNQYRKKWISPNFAYNMCLTL